MFFSFFPMKMSSKKIIIMFVRGCKCEVEIPCKLISSDNFIS